MNILDSIRRRRSVRTFDGNMLQPEDAQKILDFAERAENPYDIPVTWRILDAKTHGLTSPVIIGTDTFIAGKCPAFLMPRKPLVIHLKRSSCLRKHLASEQHGSPGQ